MFLHRSGSGSWPLGCFLLLSLMLAVAFASSAVAQSATPEGSEFQVNSYTTSAQYDPSVSVASDAATRSWIQKTRSQPRIWQHQLSPCALTCAEISRRCSSGGHHVLTLYSQRCNRNLLFSLRIIAKPPGSIPAASTILSTYSMA